MRKTEKVRYIREVFDRIYPDVKCSLNYENPVQMLIATQLSAQCTDARVNIVTQELFKRYRTAEDFANADILELQGYIKSAGFYKNKSKNIIACCRRLVDVYGGQVPDNMDDLLTLAGTGRKTANLVLGDIFKQPAVVVDTHCIRLSNRIGLVKDEDPVKIEFALKKIVPEDYQVRFCHHLVHHGRMVCNARNPKCEICEIQEYCNKTGVKGGK